MAQRGKDCQLILNRMRPPIRSTWYFWSCPLWGCILDGAGADVNTRGCTKEADDTVLILEIQPNSSYKAIHMAGEARRGDARRYEARRGEARRGGARRGEARTGEWARRGDAMRGEARPRGCIKAADDVTLVLGMKSNSSCTAMHVTGEAGRGEAGRSETMRGETSRGEARRDEAGRGKARRRGEARRCEARRGEAGRGEARPGGVR